MSSGCGLTDRAVAFDTGSPQFDSNHCIISLLMNQRVSRSCQKMPFYASKYKKGVPLESSSNQALLPFDSNWTGDCLEATGARVMGSNLGGTWRSLEVYGRV